VTPLLTKLKGFLPYLFVLTGPLLQIVSLTTNATVKSFDLRKFFKVPVNRVTCITHRYVLLFSKKSD